jgi:hypothetical protein
MKSDIRLSTDFRDHPKIVRLQKVLGDAGICALVTLWAWVRKYRPKGILTGMDIDDIENGAKWSGQSGLFVRTIIELKLLDLNGNTYTVHDWEEHQSWAYYSEERSQRSRLAAEGRWKQKKEPHTSSSSPPRGGVRTAEETHRGRINGSQETNAPSPPPNPPPFPIPSPTPVYESETPYAATPRRSQSPSQSQIRIGTDSKHTRRLRPESQSESQQRTEAFFEEFLARDLSTWEQAYPAINVRADALKAKLWLLANPKNRKKNLERFITNWFARSQEKGARGKVNREPDCPYAPGSPEHKEYLAAAKRWEDQG